MILISQNFNGINISFPSFPNSKAKLNRFLKSIFKAEFHSAHLKSKSEVSKGH